MRLYSSLLLMVLLTFTSSDLLISQENDQVVEHTLNVYITSRTLTEVESADKKKLKKELEKKSSEAKNQKKDLEKQLKSQFGKDKKKWPIEIQQKFKEAEDTERMITVELVALNNIQKDLDDTASDIKNCILGEGIPKVKKHINLVEKLEQADLAAEVMSRMRVGIPGLVACTDCTYYVYLKVIPQGKIVAKNLSSMKPENFGVRRIHQYRNDEPFWVIEASSLGRWGNAANQAAGSLNNFIEENFSILTSEESQAAIQ